MSKNIDEFYKEIIESKYDYKIHITKRSNRLCKMVANKDHLTDNTITFYDALDLIDKFTDHFGEYTKFPRILLIDDIFRFGEDLARVVYTLENKILSKVINKFYSGRCSNKSYAILSAKFQSQITCRIYYKHTVELLSTIGVSKNITGEIYTDTRDWIDIALENLQKLRQNANNTQADGTNINGWIESTSNGIKRIRNYDTIQTVIDPRIIAKAKEFLINEYIKRYKIYLVRLKQKIKWSSWSTFDSEDNELNRLYNCINTDKTDGYTVAKFLEEQGYIEINTDKNYFYLTDGIMELMREPVEEYLSALAKIERICNQNSLIPLRWIKKFTEYLVDTGYSKDIAIKILEFVTNVYDMGLTINRVGAIKENDKLNKLAMKIF